MSIADRLSLPRIHWGWLVLLIGLGALAWASRSVAGPFIAGFILAYLLDPAATRLQRTGLGRGTASAIALVVAVALLAGLVLASAPIIQEQIAQLIVRAPGIIDSAVPLAEDLMRRTASQIDVKGLLETMAGRALGWLTDSAGSIIAGGLGLVSVVNFLIVTPIVAFYLLRDWPGIVGAVESWWPRRQLPAFRQVMKDSDAALGGFLRGQLIVCLVLAVFYAVGWSLVGLDHAIVLGILAGVLAFVPFLGVIVAVVLSLLVALGQFGLDWLQLLLVFGVFQSGQIVERAFLTPKLIGDRIGLHPVWVLFAVFAGGAVAGIAGVFMAVPVAAVLGVVVRAMLANYRQSNFYGQDRP
ncbi:AI-2E family transporter [Polymorphobacter multimanifer]|nr:AI-2E family transporter [Polymorphobacter multimanifer]